MKREKKWRGTRAGTFEENPPKKKGTNTQKVRLGRISSEYHKISGMSEDLRGERVKISDAAIYPSGGRKKRSPTEQNKEGGL